MMRTLGKKGDQFWGGGDSGTNINGFILRGEIYVASDFPTLAEAKPNDAYRIMQAVTDNDPTKTDTGQSFDPTENPDIALIVSWNGTDKYLNISDLANQSPFTKNALGEIVQWDSNEPLNLQNAGERDNSMPNGVYDTIGNMSRQSNTADRLQTESIVITRPNIALGTENLFAFHVMELYDNNAVNDVLPGGTEFTFFYGATYLGSLIGGNNFLKGATALDTATNFANAVNGSAFLNTYIQTAVINVVPYPQIISQAITAGYDGNMLNIVINDYNEGFSVKSKYFEGGGTNKVLVSGQAKIAVRTNLGLSTQKVTYYERDFGAGVEFTNPYSNSILPVNPDTKPSSAVSLQPDGSSLTVDFHESTLILDDETIIKNAIFAFTTQETNAQITNLSDTSLKTERNSSTAIKQVLYSESTIKLDQDGFGVEPIAGTLQFDLNEGYFVGAGVNAPDNYSEWRKLSPAQTPCKFYYAMRNPSASSGYSLYNSNGYIIPNRYDPNLSIGRDALPSGTVGNLNWSNHLLYIQPVSGVYIMVFGKNGSYVSAKDAISGIDDERQALLDIVKRLKLVGCWSVRGNCTDLSDTSQAVWTKLSDSSYQLAISKALIEPVKSNINRILGNSVIDGIAIDFDYTSGISAIDPIAITFASIANGNTLTFRDLNVNPIVSVTATIGTDLQKGATDAEFATNLTNYIAGNPTLSPLFATSYTLTPSFVFTPSAKTKGVYGNKLCISTNNPTAFAITSPALFGGGYSRVSISEGTVEFTDAASNPKSPTLYQFNMETVSGLELTYRSVAPITHLLYYRSNGNVYIEQKYEEPTREDLWFKIYWGVAVHLLNGATNLVIDAASNTQVNALQTLNQNFYLVPQGWSPAGEIRYQQATTMKLKIDASGFNTPGANRTNLNDPNHLTIPEIPLLTDELVFTYRKTGGGFAVSPQINPDGINFNTINYDDNSGGLEGINKQPSGVLAPNTYCTHWVFREHTSAKRFTIIQSGQKSYGTQAQAIADIDNAYNSLVKSTAVNPKWIYGYIIIRSQATDASVADNYLFRLYNPSSSGVASGSVPYSPSAKSNQIYFDKSGNDANSGLTEELPKLTVLSAISYANATATSNNPITVKSNGNGVFEPTADLVISNGYVEMDCPNIWLKMGNYAFVVQHAVANARQVFNIGYFTSSNTTNYNSAGIYVDVPANAIVTFKFGAVIMGNSATIPLFMVKGRCYISSSELRPALNSVAAVFLSDSSDVWLNLNVGNMAGYINSASNAPTISGVIGRQNSSINNVTPQIGTERYSLVIQNLSGGAENTTAFNTKTAVTNSKSLATTDSSGVITNILNDSGINKLFQATGYAAYSKTLTGGNYNVTIDDIGCNLKYDENTSGNADVNLPNLETLANQKFRITVSHERITQQGKVTIHPFFGSTQTIKFYNKSIGILGTSNGIAMQKPFTHVYLEAVVDDPNGKYWKVIPNNDLVYNDDSSDSFPMLISNKYRQPKTFITNTGAIDFYPQPTDSGSIITLKAGTSSVVNVFLDSGYPSGTFHVGLWFTFIAEKNVAVTINFDQGNGFYLSKDLVDYGNITTDNFPNPISTEQVITLAGVENKRWKILSRIGNWIP